MQFIQRLSHRGSSHFERSLLRCDKGVCDNYRCYDLDQDRHVGGIGCPFPQEPPTVTIFHKKKLNA